jgi:amino acid transporter
MITITCILLHRLRGRELPYARYSLGKWGVLTNIVALIYVTPIFIFSFFPSAPKPTATSMNWAILMVGGVILLATIYYLVYGRKQYSPPNDTVEDYIQRAQTEAQAGMGSEKEASGGVTKESVVDAEKRDW